MPPPNTKRNTEAAPPSGSIWALTFLQVIAVSMGAAALALAHGFGVLSSTVRFELDVLFLVLATVLAMVAIIEWFGTARGNSERPQWVPRGLILITVLGALVLVVMPVRWLTVVIGNVSRIDALGVWGEIVVAGWVAVALLRLFRAIRFHRLNPALVLVLSFVVLVAVGTVLLMMPRATLRGEPAPLLTALFTATSAACVTGLIVVDTGTYWSSWGHWVILTLIQLGGLGIMTFGAFVALLTGQGLMIRHSALLGALFENRVISKTRRLVLSILAFSFISEVVGAILLSGLWEDRTINERVFLSVFHSVSAFCNAGFSLDSTNFESYGVRWQIWGVVSGLVILGGIGFSVLYNVTETAVGRVVTNPRGSLFQEPRPRLRLLVSTRLVLITSGILLVAGTVGLIICEQSNALFVTHTWDYQLAHAWFQSVVSRTAGFNTVAIGQMSEASQFLLVLLMFIGASPGSTGGGIKTVVIATVLLALVAVLKGRSRVEVFRRTIPDVLVRRALLIGALGTAVVVGVTMLLMILEGSRGQFLAYLFEATSAFATVGLSTGITPELKTASKLVIVATMFVGRVGPLTLLMALAGWSAAERYRYPEEQIILG